MWRLLDIVLVLMHFAWDVHPLPCSLETVRNGQVCGAHIDQSVGGGRERTHFFTQSTCMHRTWDAHSLSRLSETVLA
jgi:hypothetical protein